MTSIKFLLGGAAALLLSGGASAAALLTSSAGYTGPSLDLSGFSGFYTFTAGPIALPGGITYTSTTGNSVIGTGGYGLADNGSSVTTKIVGINSGVDTVRFTFATPVSMFGGGMNYAVSNGAAFGTNPTIAAFDASNNLIGSYDLLSLAPISTPNATDAFAFRGIDGGGVDIASFTLTGSFLIIQGGGVVPEPATWALMIGGFGLVGVAARRRRTALTA